MLLWVLDWLEQYVAAEAVALEKITLRAALAAAVSFLLAIGLGPSLIRWLKARFREPPAKRSARLDRLSRQKHWTPTMGGLFIVAGIFGSVLLFGRLSNPYPLVALGVALGLTLIGAVDDLTKLRTGTGLGTRPKLVAQLAVALVASLLMMQLQLGHAATPMLHVPAVGWSVPLGWIYVPVAALVILGSTNAVNLTDGLDGLAGGCLIFATAAMGLVVYVAGHAQLAAYLAVPHVPEAGEMLVVAGGMIGGLMGFLWFNCHPAQVFMGDTGSLPLGGLLAMLALAARQELLLIVVGGVFVVETLSVILQVGVYKWRRRRVLLCAPLHHHFQFLGWPEGRIVVRFWIAAALCALAGVGGLKVTLSEPGADPHAPSVRISKVVSPNGPR